MPDPKLQADALKPMRWSRMVICLLGATVLVLGLLAVSLHYFDEPREVAADGVRAFEVEYLTPEEAAALLGEQPER